MLPGYRSGLAFLLATVVVVAERLSLTVLHLGSTLTLPACLALGVLSYLLGLVLADRHALVDVRSFLMSGL